MLTFNNQILCFNGRWSDIRRPDPYNPLDLPPFTAQLRYTDGVTPTFKQGSTSVQISQSPNLWNVTYNDPDWSNMFYDHNDLLEIMGMNSTGVTNMHDMCHVCKQLTSVALFDTSSVTDAGSMFYYCRKLTSVPLYDTHNVTNMSGMFMDCLSLRTVPLFNTSKVTDMSYMFARANGPENDLLIDGCPLFDTHNVTNMEYMFWGSNVPEIPQFNTSNVTNMDRAFSVIPIVSLPVLDTSNVINMRCIVCGCPNLTAIPNWNTSKVKIWNSAFAETPSMLSLPAHLDYSAATDLRSIAAYNPTKNSNILALYNKLSVIPSVIGNPNVYTGAFYNCGIDTVQGAAELAQIPSDWKGNPDA